MALFLFIVVGCIVVGMLIHQSEKREHRNKNELSVGQSKDAGKSPEKKQTPPPMHAGEALVEKSPFAKKLGLLDSSVVSLEETVRNLRAQVTELQNDLEAEASVSRREDSVEAASNSLSAQEKASSFSRSEEAETGEGISQELSPEYALEKDALREERESAASDVVFNAEDAALEENAEVPPAALGEKMDALPCASASQPHEAPTEQPDNQAAAAVHIPHKAVVVPEEPSFLERAWQGIGNLGITKFIAASNVWVLAGIAIMLVGLVFLVRFAMQFSFFGPEVRLAFAALVGLGLLALGWRHRETQKELGLILQGGGVGAIYLTVVAALKLYDMIPPSLAFGLLVCVVVFSTLLAILQNARSMAHVSNIAGFLAPLLVSDGSGNYIALFTYYLLLNLGIVAISRFRPWRSLHFTGFFFVVVIGGMWGAQEYSAELFSTVEPFLVVFYLLFTYLAVAGSNPASFILQQKKDLYLDIPLTLGTPLVFICYQLFVVREMPFIAAFTSLGMGLLYLVIASRMWGSYKKPSAAPSAAQSATPDATPDATADVTPSARAGAEKAVARGRKVQAEIYLALGIIFTNLTLPFALADFGYASLGNRLLGIVWCMEAASLYWIGRKHAVRIFQWAGIACFILGTLFFAENATDGQSATYLAAHGLLSGDMDVDAATALSPATIVGLLANLFLYALGAATFFCAAYASKLFAKAEPVATQKISLQEGVFLAIGICWLLLAPFAEIAVTSALFWPCTVVWLLCVACVARCCAARFSWQSLQYIPLACYIPLLGVVFPAFVDFCFTFFGGEDFVTRNSTFDGALTFGFVAICCEYLFVALFAVSEFVALRNAPSVQALPWGVQRHSVALNLTCLMLFLFTLTTTSALFAIPATWMRALFIVWPLLFVAVLSRQAAEKFLFPALAQQGVPSEAARLLGFEKKLPPSLKHLWLSWSVFPAGMLAFWFLISVFIQGETAPIPFIPLLNPLDIGMTASLFVLYVWAKKLQTVCSGDAWTAGLCKPVLWLSACFLLGNVFIWRAASIFGGMPYTLHGIMQNGSAQALMAIFWGAAGVFAMLRGHKKQQRSVWIAGAFLIILDVIKLFLVDLTRVETVWRIVAFMIVGGLLVFIGFRSARPPVASRPQNPREKE